MKLDHFASALLDAAPDAVIVTDQLGQLVLLNRQAERLFEQPRAALLGTHLHALVADLSPDPGDRIRSAALISGGPAFELSMRRSDGTAVPVEVSLAPVRIEGREYTIAVLRDLTDRRKLEDHLRFVSTHDALTGLANRTSFDQALVRLERLGVRPVGVVMVDLDGLKRVNDEQGHAAGDELLRRAALVLAKAFRANDVVARIGGDEFAVLALGNDAARVESLARRLDETVQRHNASVPQLPALRLSIGTAIAEDSASLERALSVADGRMYAMKRRHGARAGLR